jgi:choline dehydrogenase-like flavoprotein
MSDIPGRSRQATSPAGGGEAAKTFSESRRAVLRAVCDTVVPSIEHDPDPTGLWRRSATEVGADQGIEQLLGQIPDEQRAGMLELLDGLEQQGITRLSQRSREQILRNVAMLGPEAAAGVSTLIGLTLFIAYGAPDPETGKNPNWEAFAYPGPTAQPRPEPKTIEPIVPSDEALELEADVCIVGSGAGGGVIAGTLAQRGLKVCVVEAGGYFNESDFNQLELWAYENMYWRGGPNQTADFNVTVYAGAGLGGGTVINWTNCLRTRPWVRDEWAREHGLEGVDGPEFDRHLDAIFERLSVNDRCSDLNGPQQRLKEGAEQLGWSFQTILRNAKAGCYDPASAAYMGFGDVSGSKLSTQKTYLQDAFDAGADILVRCFVDRVLVENGRAAGVEGTWTDPESGRSARVTVRAPQVVVASGSLESPALLLRSGIGGPAVGNYLRIHPCTAIFGIYPDDQMAWWGPPQAGLVDEHAALEGGHGFLIETTQYGPSLIGSALPFTTAPQHKELMEKVRYGATFIGLLRDHGHGRVEVDRDGQAVPFYALDDELDVRNTHRAIEAQARLHEAAGAREIHPMAAGAPRWRQGDDLAAYLARWQRVPLAAGGFRLFCAHQMGTCRMGKDPATSVAGPWGELHDTKGVWIGDGSAFPTASGTNPMISIMALAHRTSEAIAAAHGGPTQERKAQKPPLQAVRP